MKRKKKGQHRVRGFAMALPLVLSFCCFSCDSFVYIDPYSAKLGDIEYSNDAYFSGFDEKAYQYTLCFTLHMNNLSYRSKTVVISEARFITANKVPLCPDDPVQVSQVPIKGTSSLSFYVSLDLEAFEATEFHAKFDGVEGRLKLRETPDEEREDLKVSFLVDGKEIHSSTVKKGRGFGEFPIYHHPDHARHCSSWRSEKQAYMPSTPILEDTAFFPDHYAYYFASSQKEKSITKINSLPPDNILSIPSIVTTGSTFEITSIGLYVICSLPYLDSLYLPASLETIYDGNFTNCPRLTHIYYAGSEEEWANIDIRCAIPKRVEIVFNAPFTYE